MFTSEHHGAIPLDALAIPAGPLAGMLAAARDQLVDGIRAAGIEAAISTDFEELLRVNETAVVAGTWFPMLPSSNPRHRRLSADNGFWLRGVDVASGAVVTVQAALRFDCSALSVARRLADLTMFYDDPLAAPEAEWCTVDSPAAEATGGTVVFTCTGWTRPDFQRRKLFALLHRASRLISWLRWQPDALIGIVEADPRVVAAWSERNMGPRHLDPSPTITYHQEGVGELPLHFMRFDRAQVFGDLAVLATAPAGAAIAA